MASQDVNQLYPPYGLQPSLMQITYLDLVYQRRTAGR